MKLHQLIWLSTITAQSIIPAALADPSMFYVDPPTSEYFRGPPGHGVLKICKLDDAPDKKIMRVPMGTYFADAGTIDNTLSGEPAWWLLTVVTTQSTQLKPGQTCTLVHARIEPTGAPPAHTEMKSVLRFEKADRRYFEVSDSGDIDKPLPNLAPWNPDFPSIHATAETDFK
jgi:hypothetical protein